AAAADGLAPTRGGGADRRLHGWYSSADASGPPKTPVLPPATNTLPFLSSVAVCCSRPAPRLPVRASVRVPGSPISAEARGGAADLQAAGGRPPPGARVVQLGRGQGPARGGAVPPGHQHLAVVQQGRRVEVAADVQAAGGGPLAGYRVVQLGRSHRRIAGAAA